MFLVPSFSLAKCKICFEIKCETKFEIQFDQDMQSFIVAATGSDQGIWFEY